jgi:hypothetical protein
MRPQKQHWESTPKTEIAKMGSANTGIDIHIDADRLIRDNRERLRFRADTFEYSSLRVQNKITGSSAISHCVNRDQRRCE